LQDRIAQTIRFPRSQQLRRVVWTVPFISDFSSVLQLLTRLLLVLGAIGLGIACAKKSAIFHSLLS
jgi:hypothetical protein